MDTHEILRHHHYFADYVDMNNLASADAHLVGVVDPFSPNRRFWPSFIDAVLATTLFRCWHILLFFAAWSSAVCLINYHVHNLSIQPTLLTVLGTVLGFVISYRTTSSFERYNEGRRLWSQIILNSRTFARLVWFHVTDTMPDIPAEPLSVEQRRIRTLIEKKTVINLLEAFAVSVKHYLRGEDGIFYEDLYHLVKFLPAYALPNGMISTADLSDMQSLKSKVSSHQSPSPTRIGFDPPKTKPDLCGAPTGISNRSKSLSAPHLPLPASAPGRGIDFLNSIPETSVHEDESKPPQKKSTSNRLGDESFLLPARLPPKYSVFDVFPFSLLVHMLTKRGQDIKGKKAARIRAKLRPAVTSHNLPLEISLYLSSYIAALQQRKVIDPPTSTAFLSSLTSLVDALTGLERILTTPIPFSYSVHLWVVTIIYCFFLPFQILATMKWMTIPGTTIASFIFFGFLVAGEEIENPFGYDKNDLNMDYFTRIIIRNELRALTATPAPDPAQWAFSPANDRAFASVASKGEKVDRVPPSEWMNRGLDQMRAALAAY